MVWTVTQQYLLQAVDDNLELCLYMHKTYQNIKFILLYIFCEANKTCTKHFLNKY